MSKPIADDYVDLKLNLDELNITIDTKKTATYKQIKEYILEKYNLVVSKDRIAYVKRKYGFIMKETSKKESATDEVKVYCSQEIDEVILETLKHFNLPIKKQSV